MDVGEIQRALADLRGRINALADSVARQQEQINALAAALDLEHDLSQALDAEAHALESGHAETAERVKRKSGRAL